MAILSSSPTLSNRSTIFMDDCTNALLEMGGTPELTDSLKCLRRKNQEATQVFVTKIKYAMKTAVLHEIGGVASLGMTFIEWMELRGDSLLITTMSEFIKLLDIWCSMKESRRSMDSSATDGHDMNSCETNEADQAFLQKASSSITAQFLVEAKQTVLRDSYAKAQEGKWSIEVNDDTVPLVATSVTYTTARVWIINLWKTAFLFGLLFCIAYFMVFVQMWSDDLVLKNAKGAPLVSLHDVVYERYIPKYFKQLPSTIVDAPIGFGLLFSIAFSIWVGGRQDPTRYMRRSLYGLCCLYGFRTLSIAVTQLPPSNPAFCKPFPATFQEYIPASLDMLSGKSPACSDMMFSGHTGVLCFILMRLWFDTANNGVKPFFRYLIRTVAVVAYCLSVTTFIAVRLHYTMDVLIGAAIGFSWAISFENSFVMLPLYTTQSGFILALLRWVESSSEPVAPSLVKMD
ncbi:hypothetical protein HDU79_009829 [Rhizoclosmatium sp. JEL0117]|nr:hypothetical protein HDU79_009829 [Rhizoclosmatium sp. JEL0117]